MNFVSPVFKHAEYVLQFSSSCPIYQTFSRVDRDCNLDSFCEVSTHIVFLLHVNYVIIEPYVCGMLKAELIFAISTASKNGTEILL